MDQTLARFDSVLREMDWEEICSTLRDAVGEMLADASSFSPPTPSCPQPAGRGWGTQPEPGSTQGCGRGGSVPQAEQPGPTLGAPSGAPGSRYVWPLYTHAQTGARFFTERPEDGHQSGAAMNHPAAPPPPRPNWNLPIILPEGVNLRPVVLLRGVFEVAAPSSVAASPRYTVPPDKKRKAHERQRDIDRPYIPRPPNAFMLFTREQRANVAAQHNITNSAAVNAILGQIWQSMTGEQQLKYFVRSRVERRLHEQRHPNWTPKENHGRKKRRG